jgi:hypothetical protein
MAQIWVNGENKHLGYHPAAEAAARAYDVVARTIAGRKFNFPVASASMPETSVPTAATAHAGLTTPSHLAPPTEQQVQPSAPRSAPPQPGADEGGDDNGCSAAAEEPAHIRKRMRSDSFDA